MPIVVIGQPDTASTKIIDTQPVEELLTETDFLDFTEKVQTLNRDQLLALAGSMFIRNEVLRRKK